MTFIDAAGLNQRLTAIHAAEDARHGHGRPTPIGFDFEQERELLGARPGGIGASPCAGVTGPGTSPPAVKTTVGRCQSCPSSVRLCRRAHAQIASAMARGWSSGE